MFCILIQPKGKTEYELFTNEVFNTEKETKDYAERNNFGKDTKWKVVEYEPKYFNRDTPQEEWIEGYNKWKEKHESNKWTTTRNSRV